MVDVLRFAGARRDAYLVRQLQRRLRRGQRPLIDDRAVAAAPQAERCRRDQVKARRIRVGRNDLTHHLARGYLRLGSDGHRHQAPEQQRHRNQFQGTHAFRLRRSSRLLRAFRPAAVQVPAQPHEAAIQLLAEIVIGLGGRFT